MRLEHILEHKIRGEHHYGSRNENPAAKSQELVLVLVRRPKDGRQRGNGKADKHPHRFDPEDKAPEIVLGFVCAGHPGAHCQLVHLPLHKAAKPIEQGREQGHGKHEASAPQQPFLEPCGCRKRGA